MREDMKKNLSNQGILLNKLEPFFGLEYKKLSQMYN